MANRLRVGQSEGCAFAAILALSESPPTSSHGDSDSARAWIKCLRVCVCACVRVLGGGGRTWTQQNLACYLLLVAVEAPWPVDQL